jgi:3-isopropylmalate/(R)-2-methylmalate dehydratase small subunit
MHKGRIWKYGDDVNTDVIFPGKYTYTITDRSEMSKYALEDLDPNFKNNVEEGDVIVAGKNFGCGSSREQAAICLKESGVYAIIAKSFSRIFFRNAINEGLPVLINKDIVNTVQMGEELEVDLKNGALKHKQKEYSFPPLPDSVLEILNSGGLVEFLKARYCK